MEKGGVSVGVPIPNYLKELAVLQEQTNGWALFSLKCTCGCNQFWVSTNHLNKEENALKKAYYDALNEVYSPQMQEHLRKDENGERHYFRFLEPEKGWDGKIEEVIIPERPFFLDVCVVRVRCAECGKEHLVFDSRLHGYSGTVQRPSQKILDYEPHLRQKGKEAVALEVWVVNDETFEKFQDLELYMETIDSDFTQEQYSNSFNAIQISRTNHLGAKRKILFFDCIVRW